MIAASPEEFLAILGGRATARPGGMVSGQTKYGLVPLKDGMHPSDLPCRCPRCTLQTPLKGKINARHLREHCERMGIKLPVRIQIEKSFAGTKNQGDHHIEEPANLEAIIEANPLAYERIVRGGAEVQRDFLARHGAEHIVRVNPLLNAENANASVLHELRHAEQREKGGVAMMDEYHRCDAMYGYCDNPWEIDAELAAQHFAGFPPIVVE